MNFKTEQEDFWAGDFGNNYIARNQGEEIVKSNFFLFSQIIKNTPNVSSIVELGCNIGLNLQALNKINKKFKLCGYEINNLAAEQARNLNISEIIDGTILDPLPSEFKYDISFTKGVLIHINPAELHNVYANLYNLSKKYILICEYYNITPITIEYRGNANKLFKRDFAGELIDKYDLRLIDYGFIYHRDNYFPQDDFTWFLLEKRS